MKLCFVVMPIGSGEAYDLYLNRYNNIIKPAVETYQRDGARVFDAVRADFISKTGSITRSVIQHIYNADLVVADLTDLNPNVFYELGVRHALRNGTILVALRGTTLPFDVDDLRTVFYWDRVGAEKDAIPEVQRLIDSIIDDGDTSDSPVFAVLPDLLEPQTRGLLEAQARVSGLEAEAEELRLKLALMEEANLRLRESFTTFERTINATIERLQPADREAAEEAIEHAVEARSEEPRKVPSHFTGVEEIPSLVFVAMPFREELEPTFQLIREAGQAAGLQVLRADQIAAPGRITDQVAGAIGRAGLIVADITGQNPNVLFEVGMATSLEKPVIVISQDRDFVPFDIAHQRIIFYENTIDGGHALREQLLKAMRFVALGAG